MQAKAEMQDHERRTFWQTRYDDYRRLASENLAKANITFFGTPDGQPTIPYRQILLHSPWLHHRPTDKATERTDSTTGRELLR